MNLECTNCPLATATGWVSGVPSKLQLNFSISHNDIETLNLNEFQIYPARNFVFYPLSALQFAADPVGNDAPANLRLGYELGVKPIAEPEQGQLELVAIRLQIIEIGSKFVDGLPSVELKLFKTPLGKLLIGDVQIGPTTNPGGKGCNTAICRLRKIIADKQALIKGIKGCGKTTAGVSAVKTFPAGVRPHHGHGHHKGQGHGHGYYKHHGYGRIIHFLKSIALHVLIPVFIGIIAGFTASMIGMLVGRTVVFIWRTFYRRGQQGAYINVRQDETACVEKGEEAKSFMEHEEQPPVYDDVIIATDRKIEE